MNKDQLRLLVDAADCMLAKTNVSEEYRNKVRQARAAALDEILKQDVEDFIAYIDQLTATESTIEAAYDLQFTITLGDRSVKIPFSATPCIGIHDMLLAYLTDEL